MKTEIKILVSLVAVIFITTSCFNGSKESNQEQITETIEPALEVDRDFLQAYMSGNQVAADEKYKDKRFLVRGMVSEITNMYEPIVKVETEVGEVECVFDKSQTSELAKLSIAQEVVIDCTFKGVIMSFRFADCKIVE